MKAIWEYCQRHRIFGAIPGIGKKKNKQLLTFCGRLKEVMQCEVLSSSGGTAPAPQPEFSITAWYHPLDSDSKKVAENIYAGYAKRLRANVQDTLYRLCDKYAMKAIINTLCVQHQLFTAASRSVYD